jgi:hypothetical protein
MWPAVLLNAPDQGCAVEDLTQLMALFAGSDLPHFLAKPRRRGALLPGEGIANRLAHQPDLRYATSTDHVIAAAQ